MRPEDFDFELPPEQIAQAPLADRDGSRLLHLTRGRDGWVHRGFRELPDLFRSGDLLVVNETRVIPARLLGTKAVTGGKVELLLIRPSAGGAPDQALQREVDALEWLCLGQASKGLKPGAELKFEGALRAQVLEALGGGEYRVRFSSEQPGTLGGLLSGSGRLPLPPYISRAPGASDDERYQTVYAQRPGSVAAPTAGLHFTPSLFEQLAAKGVERVALTLDVGPGTFLPVREGELDRHKMHQERFEIPAATAAAIHAARREGRRVVAVGTTVVRSLEAATDEASGEVRPGEGSTALFIRPGYRFCQVDALVTNFHLPRSTLLMLVSAFAGQPLVLRAYREAVAQGYRFFSYGDAMLID